MFHLLSAGERERLKGSIVPLGNGVAYAHVDNERRYCEANPDVTFVSAPQSFWTHLEVEYKLEARAPRERCLEALTAFRSHDYSLSAVWPRKSFERYRCFRDRTGASFYLAVLGKRGWRLPVAMKYKIAQPHPYPEGFHVRSVAIGPYSEAAAARAASSYLHVPARALRVRNLPAYYSDKMRRIALHRSIGLVYCISFGYAKPVSVALPARSQFEIEYWSRLLPAGAPEALGSHLLYRSEFLDIARAFWRHLERLNVPVTPSNVTRVGWLERLSHANS